MKKVLILLCVVLLLAAPVFLVQAEETGLQQDETLMQEAKQLYRSCLYSAGRSSFQGMCGLATSYQLWKLGINENIQVYDGNKQFDAYRNVKTTTGGHSVAVYSAEAYTLGEALNSISNNGTRSVRNILVGFQWTNTEAGKYYGHACVINAIQDGTVYFTESFNYAMGRMEGQVITCSIDQFVDFFDDWTVFEGVIYFGTKQYANVCQAYGTDLYVQLRFDSNLRSQPCVLGMNDSVSLRSLAAGELLHATAVYVNDEGDLFYQINDGGITGYVSANAVYLTQYNDNGVQMRVGNLPISIELGEDPVLSGAVTAENCQLTQLDLQITDQTGAVVIQSQVDVADNKANLSQMDETVALDTLDLGNYTLTVTAQTLYATAEEGVLATETMSQTLVNQPLEVGTDGSAISDPEDRETKDGWFVDEGVWYCYDNGQPCTGWTTRIGVSYYLKEDGSVTTGWMEQGDKIYYFSATGAQCSGWITTAEGSYYLTGNGSLAKGLQQINGQSYCFGEDGKLLRSGTVTYDKTVYQIQQDGVALPME